MERVLFSTDCIVIWTREKHRIFTHTFPAIREKVGNLSSYSKIYLKAQPPKPLQNPFTTGPYHKSMIPNGPTTTNHCIPYLLWYVWTIGGLIEYLSTSEPSLCGWWRKGINWWKNTCWSLGLSRTTKYIHVSIPFIYLLLFKENERHSVFQAIREQLVQLMFETFNISGFYASEQAVLSLYAVGRISGCTVDIGHGKIGTETLSQQTFAMDVQNLFSMMNKARY